ncbi:MAG: hypothetical protein ACLFUE_05265 [Desulfobacteraceae bacterium]
MEQVFARSSIFNFLKNEDMLMLAEGLNVFRIKTPQSLKRLLQWLREKNDRKRRQFKQIRPDGPALPLQTYSPRSTLISHAACRHRFGAASRHTDNDTDTGRFPFASMASCEYDQ